jgi:hypothetical protein
VTMPGVFSWGVEQNGVYIGRHHRDDANAALAVSGVPEYANADHVEGMAVLGFLPIEHGWAEKDGVIVDPTLPLKQGVCFPRFRFTGQRGFAEMLWITKAKHTPKLPISYRLGRGGTDSPEFRAACPNTSPIHPTSILNFPFFLLVFPVVRII